MFLMFRLGRPDVLPVDDYGIRKAMQRVYRKRALPKPEWMRRTALVATLPHDRELVSLAQPGRMSTDPQAFTSWFVARHPDIGMARANAVIELAGEGATVPFIARYRKEQTGNLDEVADPKA